MLTYAIVEVTIMRDIDPPLDSERVYTSPPLPPLLYTSDASIQLTVVAPWRYAL